MTVASFGSEDRCTDSVSRCAVSPSARHGQLLMMPPTRRLADNIASRAVSAASNNWRLCTQNGVVATSAAAAAVSWQLKGDVVVWRLASQGIVLPATPCLRLSPFPSSLPRSHVCPPTARGRSRQKFDTQPARKESDRQNVAQRATRGDWFINKSWEPRRMRNARADDEQQRVHGRKSPESSTCQRVAVGISTVHSLFFVLRLSFLHSV